MSMMQYFRFFQDLWRFFKAHSNPVSADSWWQRLADQGDALADRYGNTEFVIRMISTAMWEIDRAYREKTNYKAEVTPNEETESHSESNTPD